MQMKIRMRNNLMKSTFHTVTIPYTDCILIHKARTLVFMIIISS